MPNGTNTDRRTFLGTISAASIWSAVQPALAGIEHPPAYAYVGSIQAGGCDYIEVFRVTGGRWVSLQKVPSQAPASLVIHPNRLFVYVANAVLLHEGLPQGTMEVFSIDPQSGQLSFVQRRALSLSATEPRSLAITPDGQHLIVAACQGGAYNVFPIEENGTIGNVRQVFKELGGSVHITHQASAHPRAVLLDTQGRFVLASDFGLDALSVFAVYEDGELCRNSKALITPGAGPGSMVLHPNGTSLYVMHELNPALSCHRYRPIEGLIETPFQIVPLPRRQGNATCVSGSLSVHPGGKFLYAASTNDITVWAIDPASGFLSLTCQGGNADALHLTQNGVLHALDRNKGAVLRMRLNEASGRWDDAIQVASVVSPASLAFLGSSL